MEAPTFWPQGYSHFDVHSRTRTINIGEDKLSLPLQPSSQHPIERFHSGENPLPMGLVPDPVHTYQGLNTAAMPGLTFSQLDGDAASWHSSIRDDDQRSSSTDSSASGHGVAAAWSQGSPVMSSCRSNSIPMAYQDTAVSPCESPYGYKPSEVIDPNLTFNFQEPDLYGYKSEPPIKFEFNFNSVDDADYEQDQYSPEPLSAAPYGHYQPPLPNFNDNWANKVPVTRSQSYNNGRTQSQSSSKGSSNGVSKSSRAMSGTTSSPISKKRPERRRSSSSSDEQPPKPSNRPKTYKKKIPYHYCQEDACRNENIFFKNKSELKKHIETQHTKPYLCIFGFAGCRQRFGARNEWKRHIATQHLVLYKYVCDHSDCVEKNKAKTIFNRGDLFMKHHERMHSPPNIYERNPDDLELIAWKKEMKEAKRRCETLRPPPQRMTCGFCSLVFEDGDKTWMELIDHVCLHYQTNDDSVKNSNGYKDDPDLIEWMKQNKLIKKEGDSMDVDSESSQSRGSRKHSYASSSESSSSQHIKQEQADSF